ncbi:MAG TPA: iron ABC transporter permease [Gemmatimonadales bacterium]|jgi:iron(III) transport system permease protein|nr:iron ABC transporter permease [Gemmatimonadales bacterium]
MTAPPRARLLAGLLLAVLAWLVIYPIALVLLEGLRDPSGWTLRYVRLFLERPTEWRALWGSLWISVVSVILAALIGIPLAFLLARYDLPGGRVLGGLVALPAVLPPLVGVVAFLFLYGETGFVSLLVQRLLGLTEPPWRLQGAGAILLVHAYSMYVYFYLFVRAALFSLDGSLYEAAASLGAGRWRTLRRVVLPQLYPALGGAALLTFMTALASFSAPYIFGGGFRVMPTQIVSTRLNGDDRLAMVETISLTILALAALWLFRGAGNVDLAGGGRKGAGPERIRVRSRALRVAVAGLGWGLAGLLLLPHLTLLLVSFVPLGTWTTEPLPPVYTLQNYVTLIQDPVRARPLLNSLWLAAVATAAAVSIALGGAILSASRRVRGGRVIETLLALPWAVPGTVFAIALATAFSVHAPWVGRVVLVGTLWILPLAYLIRNLPITSRAILAGIRGLDPSLDEAAAALGAGRGRTLRRITLPLLRPALLAGASLAFVTALGDFVTSIMLYTYDTRPISLEILSSLRQSDVGVAAAYGVVLMVISGAVFAFGADRGGSG